MTRIQPLPIVVGQDQLSYGDGLVLVVQSDNPPTLSGYYVLPTLLINVPPAPADWPPTDPGGGGGDKPVWPVFCSNHHCDSCTHTPCVVVPVKGPPGPHPRPWIAIKSSLSFGVEEIHIPPSPGGPLGPLLEVLSADTPQDILARIEEWIAGQSSDLTFHVYQLDVAHPPSGVPAGLLGQYLVVPVAPVPEGQKVSLEEFFSER